jgi:N-methylhydantoinase A
MLSADPRLDFVRTEFIRLQEAAPEDLEGLFGEIEREAVEASAGLMSGATVPLAFERSADMRYVGQEHAVTVRMPAAIDDLDAVKLAFDEAHERLYSHSAPSEPAEFVTARVSVSMPVEKPRWAPLGASSDGPASEALVERREVGLGGSAQLTSTAIYDRGRLRAGDVIEGPAVLEEPASTTVVDVGDKARVHPLGHLIVTLR